MSGALVFLLLGCLVFSSSAQKSQICTQTSIEVYATKDDPNLKLFDYSATLLTKDISGNSLTQLIITDEAFSSSDSSLYKLNGEGLKEIVGNKRSTRCQSIGGYCSWLVGNETAVASLPLTMDNITGEASVIFNIVDEGGISLLSGELFSDSLECDEISDESNYYSY